MPTASPERIAPRARDDRQPGAPRGGGRLDHRRVDLDQVRRHGPQPAGDGPAHRARPRGAARHQDAGERVDEERQHEQHDRQGDERRQLEVAGLAELERDDAREGRAGAEQRSPELGAVAEQEGDRDRLADGASEAERRGADDARARPRQHRVAHHLPAGRAEGVRGLLLVARDREEDLAGDGRDDRQDHHAQDQAGEDEGLPGDGPGEGPEPARVLGDPLEAQAGRRGRARARPTGRRPPTARRRAGRPPTRRRRACAWAGTRSWPAPRRSPGVPRRPWRWRSSRACRR